MVKASKTSTPSLGIQLLADLRSIFGESDSMTTEAILKALHGLEESPWSDLRGKPLDARGLANRLRKYEVRSKKIRTGETTAQGYTREDLWDAWIRYPVGEAAYGSGTSGTSGTENGDAVEDVPHVPDVPDVAPPTGGTPTAGQNGRCQHTETVVMGGKTRCAWCHLVLDDGVVAS